MSSNQKRPSKSTTTATTTTDDRYEGFYPKLQKRRHYDYDSDDELEDSLKRYPGDKSYKSPEYSAGFHKQGTIRPIVTFGSNYKPPVVTTAHLVKNLPDVTPDSNLSVTMSKKIREAEDRENTEKQARLLNSEKNEVEGLDDWHPADPLKPPNFEQVSKRYGPNSIGFIRRVSNAGSNSKDGHSIGKKPATPGKNIKDKNNNNDKSSPAKRKKR